MNESVGTGKGGGGAVGGGRGKRGINEIRHPGHIHQARPMAATSMVEFMLGDQLHFLGLFLLSISIYRASTHRSYNLILLRSKLYCDTKEYGVGC